MLDFRPKFGVSAIVLDNAQSLQNGPGQGKASTMHRISKTALTKAKPSLYFLKNKCSWNGPRPGAAMQLLVTDPSATHALHKSLLDCNALVLSACGIEDDLFHRAPC